MEVMFIAYLVNDGEIMGDSGYDILVKKIDNDMYQELITGDVFKNYRDSDKGLSIILCNRIDPNYHHKYIDEYLRYEEGRVRSIIGKMKKKKLTK